MSQAREVGVGPALPDISITSDTAEELLRARMLEPPAHPGLAGALGEYQVLRLLGAGGMSLVMLARDTRTGALVAIKMLRPQLVGVERATRRFLGEARHMRRLEHPNVLRVLEVCEREEGPYFVLPYMRRGSLANLIRPGEPLDEKLTMRIARDVAEALSYAHARGITHRDIKPSNVLLDEDGRACLADFGLGRTVFNDTLVDVRQEQTEGTPAYMAPEVANGEAGDTRCDTYSFGALLYEMLTGRPPYVGVGTADVLQQVRAGAPASVSQANPQAHPGLRRIAEWAMARDLRERYASMVDVAADVARVMEGHEPRGPRGAGRDSARVKSRAGAVLAAVCLAVIVLAGGMFWRGGQPAPRLQISYSVPLPPGVRGINALVGDLDGDGEKDLFVLDGDRVRVFSRDGQLLATAHLAAPGRYNILLGLVADADGDGCDDSFVGWAEGDRLTAVVLNANLHPVRHCHTQGAVFDWRGTPLHPNIEPRMIVDLNGDGRRELLAFLGMGYGLKPRGLCCFDLGTGQLLWRWEIGPHPLAVATADLDGDGRLEVLLGSHAVANGNVAEDGSSDDGAYIHAFADDGRPLWITRLADYFCGAQPLVLKPPAAAKPVVLAWCHGSGEARRSVGGGAAVGQVVRLGDGGVVEARYDAGVELFSAAVVDLGSGPRVIVTDGQGTAHALDDRLTLLSKVQLAVPRYDAATLRFHGHADLDGDGIQDLIFSSMQRQRVAGDNHGDPAGERNLVLFHDNSVIVATPQFKVLAQQVVGSVWRAHQSLNVHILDMDGDGRQELLVLGEEAQVLTYR